MSLRPMPPRRSDTKYNVRPSAESDGCDSQSAEFTFAPRFFGSDQSLPTFLLSNKSQLPYPSRPTQEVKINNLPSAEIVLVPSLRLELMCDEMDCGESQRPLSFFFATTRSSSSSGPLPSRRVKISSC